MICPENKQPEGPSGPSSDEQSEIPVLKKCLEPTPELIVERCKNAPAPRDDDFDGMALPSSLPDWITPMELIALLGICAKYAERLPIQDQDWYRHQDEINSLMRKGLLIESYENYGEVPMQIIPTMYCSLCCVSLTHPYQWEGDL